MNQVILREYNLGIECFESNQYDKALSYFQHAVWLFFEEEAIAGMEEADYDHLRTFYKSIAHTHEKLSNRQAALEWRKRVTVVENDYDFETRDYVLRKWVKQQFGESKLTPHELAFRRYSVDMEKHWQDYHASAQAYADLIVEGFQSIIGLAQASLPQESTNQIIEYLYNHASVLLFPGRTQLFRDFIRYTHPSYQIRVKKIAKPEIDSATELHQIIIAAYSFCTSQPIEEEAEECLTNAACIKAIAKDRFQDMLKASFAELDRAEKPPHYFYMLSCVYSDMNKLCSPLSLEKEFYKLARDCLRDSSPSATWQVFLNVFTKTLDAPADKTPVKQDLAQWMEFLLRKTILPKLPNNHFTDSLQKPNNKTLFNAHLQKLKSELQKTKEAKAPNKSPSLEISDPSMQDQVCLKQFNQTLQHLEQQLKEVLSLNDEKSQPNPEKMPRKSGAQPPRKTSKANGEIKLCSHFSDYNFDNEEFRLDVAGTEDAIAVLRSQMAVWRGSKTYKKVAVECKTQDNQPKPSDAKNEHVKEEAATHIHDSTHPKDLLHLPTLNKQKNSASSMGRPPSRDSASSSAHVQLPFIKNASNKDKPQAIEHKSKSTEQKIPPRTEAPTRKTHVNPPLAPILATNSGVFHRPPTPKRPDSARLLRRLNIQSSQSKRATTTPSSPVLQSITTNGPEM